MTSPKAEASRQGSHELLLLPGRSKQDGEIILLNTFKFLTSTQLQVCAEVCSEWGNLIISKVGIALFIGKKSSNWVNVPVGFEHPNIVGKMASPFISVSDLSYPPEELCPLKYPNVLQSLVIDGPITSTNFNIIFTNPFTNLMDLAIDWTTLNVLQLRQVSSLHFPSLKCLRLINMQSKDLALSSPTNNWDLARDNIIALLEQTYPKLAKLYLNFLPMYQNITQMIWTATNCISRHKSTLKKILMDFIQFQIPETSNHNATNEVMEMILDNDTLLASCKGLALTHGFIRCSQGFRNISPINILSQIILQASSLTSSLKNIYLDTGLHPTMPINTLKQHKSTLVSMELDVNPLNGFIDCAEFRQCCNLQVLTLIGRLKRVTRSSVENIPELIETSQLPNSLKSLRLCRLRVNTSNADYLLTNVCSNLTLLELQEIGSTDGLGLSMSSIHKAMQARKVHKLSLCKAINMDSLNSLLPTGYISYCANPLGFLLLKQEIEKDPNYQFGIYLFKNLTSGQSFYQIDWNSQQFNNYYFFKFQAHEPNMYFSSNPLNMDLYDDDNTVVEGYDDEGSEDSDIEDENAQEGANNVNNEEVMEYDMDSDGDDDDEDNEEDVDEDEDYEP